MKNSKISKGAGVAGILFNQEKELLLIKRRDVPIWVLPGGGIDFNERPEQTIKREFLEETQISIEPARLVAEYLPSGFFTRHTFVYECSYVSGSPKKGSETMDIGFFPMNALPEIFFPIHLNWTFQSLKNEPALIEKTEGLSFLNLLSYASSHPLLSLRFLLSRMGFPINTSSFD